MAAADSTHFPVKNQAYRLYFVIRNPSTNQVVTGGLGTLAGSYSLDGGAETATATPVEISTTGRGYVDLTAAQINGSHVGVIITATTANTEDIVANLYPVDLDESGTRAPSQTVKKMEQYVLESNAAQLNKFTINRSSGAMTIYGIDGATVRFTGTAEDDGTTNTRGALA